MNSGRHSGRTRVPENESLHKAPRELEHPAEDPPSLAKRLRGLALRLAAPAALVLALALAAPAPSPAQSQDPLARTSQVTDAKEQLGFGVKMARRGLWSEALFRFKQAQRLDPSNARILNNMAVAYEALGQFDRALDTYQQAVRLQSTDRDLRKNYSRFVEFYRAFRPDEQKDASVDASEAANDNESAAAAAETESAETESAETESAETESAETENGSP